jgi:VWFA-related protein
LIRNKLMAFKLILFLLLAIAFLGCSGGGDEGGSSPTPSPSSPPTPSPSIEVLPTDYDFGSVTPGNSPAPLEVQIANKGTLGLIVKDIALADPNFLLNLNGGSNPCYSASSTIPASGNCTVEVAFQPTSDAHFDGTLIISSNDPDNPKLNVLLSGTREPISELNVKINQVETSCPSQVVTTYVSVTDQGGYPVTGLTQNDFQVTETGTGGYVGTPTNASFVLNTATLSVALVMDYSGSITGSQDSVNDMEKSVANFVDNLGTNDEAEIIKFATTIAVAQDYISDKTLLKDAVYSTLDVGTHTALYDAVVKAVDDTSLRSKNRKAVIVMTDGYDDDGSGNQISNNSLNDAINYAKSKGIPIFPVGLGDQINLAILQQIADDTGGQFYVATTSDNLKTIYQQLADILFKDQYILTYTSGLGAPGNLTIEATLQPTITGDDTRAITTCP